MSVLLEEYFLCVIRVGFFVAVALSLAHPKLKSVTNFGAGIVMICVIMLPLVDIIKDFSLNGGLDGIFDGIDYEAEDSAIELAFELGVAEYVAKTYGTDRECVGVNADDFDIGTLTAERIYVTLRGEAMLLDYKKIEEELAAEFTAGGECEVSVSFG